MIQLQIIKVIYIFIRYSINILNEELMSKIDNGKKL